MIENILNFFYMNGHGIYVFSAYGLVAIFLIWQWFTPWRRWQKFITKHEQNS